MQSLPFWKSSHLVSAAKSSQSLSEAQMLTVLSDFLAASTILLPPPQSSKTEAETNASNLSDIEIVEELERCAESFEYFCNNYAWVIEPRPKAVFRDGSDLDFDEYLTNLKLHRGN